MSGGRWSQAARRRAGRWGNSRRGGWRVNASPEDREARLKRVNRQLAWTFVACFAFLFGSILAMVIVATTDPAPPDPPAECAPIPPSGAR